MSVCTLHVSNLLTAFNVISLISILLHVLSCGKDLSQSDIGSKFKIIMNLISELK